MLRDAVESTISSGIVGSRDREGGSPETSQRVKMAELEVFPSQPLEGPGQVIVRGCGQAFHRPSYQVSTGTKTKGICSVKRTVDSCVSHNTMDVQGLREKDLPCGRLRNRAYGRSTYNFAFESLPVS